MTTTTTGKATRAVAAILVVCCALSSLADLFYLLEWPPSDSPRGHLRRSLQQDGGGGAVIPRSVFPWARSRLRPVDKAPEPEKEVVVFWHVPKSGGTTLKSIYECMGKTIANRAGVDPRFEHHNEDEIVAFRPWPGVSKASYVNVDTTSRAGIDRAKKLGLVESGVVDMIVTSDPTYAVENLFDATHKGRVMALFRHPIDRLVSRFYYLREAKWEKQYRPQWKRIDILEYAKVRNTDNDHMVKKMAGIAANATATEAHLRVAMRTIEKRFIVGLMDQMEESVRRFNIVMGIIETDENKKCMDHFFHDSLGAKRHKSNSHPQVKKESATWNALAKRNKLDLRLYDYILQLFDEQRGIIESYSKATESAER